MDNFFVSVDKVVETVDKFGGVSCLWISLWITLWISEWWSVDKGKIWLWISGGNVGVVRFVGCG